MIRTPMKIPILFCIQVFALAASAAQQHNPNGSSSSTCLSTKSWADHYTQGAIGTLTLTTITRVTVFATVTLGTAPLAVPSHDSRPQPFNLMDSTSSTSANVSSSPETVDPSKGDPPTGTLETQRPIGSSTSSSSLPRTASLRMTASDSPSTMALLTSLSPDGGRIASQLNSSGATNQDVPSTTGVESSREPPITRPAPLLSNIVTLGPSLVATQDSLGLFVGATRIGPGDPPTVIGTYTVALGPSNVLSINDRTSRVPDLTQLLSSATSAGNITSTITQIPSDVSTLRLPGDADTSNGWTTTTDSEGQQTTAAVINGTIIWFPHAWQQNTEYQWDLGGTLLLFHFPTVPCISIPVLNIPLTPGCSKNPTPPIVLPPLPNVGGGVNNPVPGPRPPIAGPLPNGGGSDVPVPPPPPPPPPINGPPTAGGGGDTPEPDTPEPDEDPDEDPDNTEDPDEPDETETSISTSACSQTMTTRNCRVTCSLTSTSSGAPSATTCYTTTCTTTEALCSIQAYTATTILHNTTSSPICNLAYTPYNLAATYRARGMQLPLGYPTGPMSSLPADMPNTTIDDSLPYCDAAPIQPRDEAAETISKTVVVDVTSGGGTLTVVSTVHPPPVRTTNITTVIDKTIGGGVSTVISTVHPSTSRRPCKPRSTI